MRYWSKKQRKSLGLKLGTVIASVLFASSSILLTCSTGEAGTISSISGAIGDGETITIKGSGFGSSGPNVVVFDDFESGTPGTNIATGSGSAKYGKWDSRAGSSFYGNTASVSGSRSFTSDYSVGYTNFIEAGLPSNTRNVFISWWLYLPSSSNYPGEGNASGINWKQMWLQGSSTSDDDLVLPSRISSWLINGNEGDPGYAKYMTLNFTKGQWKRIWVWLKGSTSSTSNDGEVKFWELTNSGVMQRVNDTGVNTLKAGGAWEKVRPNGYGRTTSNCLTSYDDIYIAAGPNAQARVEIGNSSVYANSTKLSILTPTSWSDGSIVAKVNTGPFKTGDSAYLYVFKADGSLSSTSQITIGAAGSGGGSTTDQISGLTFTAPTTGSSYTTEISDSQKTITISGTASDDNGIQSVTYTINDNQSQNASTGNGYANWSVPVVVDKGSTVVATVTATDNAGQTTSKTMTLTAVSASTTGSPVIWSANQQTGDSSWSNSSVTYSARLLVKGDSITEGATSFVLGLQGRTSGSYTIRNVSIAERDTSGNEGDVIDSTWNRVFFDGTAWNNIITVPSGEEKLSDPIYMNLNPGTDYYITFKIETPSVYLDPPSGYRELYFTNEDHSSDVDWGSNGHSVSQDFHALSKIYVSTSGETTSPPPTPDFHKK